MKPVERATVQLALGVVLGFAVVLGLIVATVVALGWFIARSIRRPMVQAARQEVSRLRLVESPPGVRGG